MSDQERYGTRSLLYSAWHRPDRMQRFVDARTAQSMAMIDIDGCEFDKATGAPLVLVETARDVGQGHKNYRVTRALAMRAGIPAIVVLFQPNADETDIDGFRVRLVAPTVESTWTRMAPDEFARYLLALREQALARGAT